MQHNFSIDHFFHMKPQAPRFPYAHPIHIIRTCGGTSPGHNRTGTQPWKDDLSHLKNQQREIDLKRSTAHDGAHLSIHGIKQVTESLDHMMDTMESKMGKVTETQF
ncbi:hypothetical protein Droror1_Dr00003273 [Drosera rotundifolia]